MVLENADKEIVGSVHKGRGLVQERFAGGGVVIQNPLTFLASDQPQSIDDVVEAVVAWSQEKLGSGEFVAAKEQFFARFGKVFPEDVFYDARMSYFLDFFLFGRPLSRIVAGESEPATPFEVFTTDIARSSVQIASRSTEWLLILSGSRHSVFQVTKVQEKMMQITDLIGPPRKYIIHPKGTETFKAFGSKDIFQGFIFNSDRSSFLSQGIVIHPRAATRVILKLLKTVQKAQDFQENQMLARLAGLQLRAIRHGHVDPKSIYSA